MSDSTDPNAPASTGEPLADRTQRVRTRIPDPAEHPPPSADPNPSTSVIDEPQPPGPVKAYGSTSTQLARDSRRSRRQQRDRRAEWRAIQVLIGLFVGIGGLALVAVNVLLDDPSPSMKARPDPSSPSSPSGRSGPVAPASTAVGPSPDNIISTPLVETVDLPALRQLRNEGLTIAAEGLPEVSVSSAERSMNTESAAARETCRFAYGIWEFSPNRRFRFLPTCKSMDGQVLFGAYEVEGTRIRMSPLRASDVSWVSEFQVEKPSRLSTRVDGGRVTLDVRQRVTVIRNGLTGDAFFGTYAAKNTLAVPGGAPPSAPPRVPPPPPRDPLLDLLRGSGKRQP